MLSSYTRRRHLYKKHKLRSDKRSSSLSCPVYTDSSFLTSEITCYIDGNSNTIPVLKRDGAQTFKICKQLFHNSQQYNFNINTNFLHFSVF